MDAKPLNVTCECAPLRPVCVVAADAKAGEEVCIAVCQEFHQPPRPHGMHLMSWPGLTYAVAHRDLRAGEIVEIEYRDPDMGIEP